MTTDALLLVGVAAAVMFPAVVLIEGARRPGYDPIYHTGSELELGERSWIQRANFFLTGIGMFAFAVGVARTPSWQGKVHNATGPVMFLALFAACLTLAGRLQGGWRLYTTLIAAAGLGLTVWTALAFQKDAANTGLVQRGLLLVYLSWIALLGIYLVTNPPQV